MEVNKSEKQIQQHKKRMQRKKAIVDASIARADKEKGVILVLTGNGKGKSSSAFGMIARALGHNMKVGVAQFIKGQNNTGEEVFFNQHPNVIWYVLGQGFTWDTQNLEQDIATAQKGWDVAKRLLNDETLGLVVLDELTYPLKYSWLEWDSVLSDINNRPTMQHVVITGRGASPSLCDIADTVTHLQDTKHAYQAGIKAQKGVDW